MSFLPISTTTLTGSWWNASHQTTAAELLFNMWVKLTTLLTFLQFALNMITLLHLLSSSSSSITFLSTIKVKLSHRLSSSLYVLITYAVMLQYIEPIIYYNIGTQIRDLNKPYWSINLQKTCSTSSFLADAAVFFFLPISTP